MYSGVTTVNCRRNELSPINTPFTRSSKLSANVFKIHVLTAWRLLEICWTSAGSLLLYVIMDDVCWTFAGSCKRGITVVRLSVARWSVAVPPATPLTNGAINQTLRHFAPRQWLSLAGWLSWIVNIDKPSVDRHPEQHNRPGLSLGYLGPHAGSINVDHATGQWHRRLECTVWHFTRYRRIATHLRCGGIYSDSFITNYLLILRVKEFWKSVNI